MFIGKSMSYEAHGKACTACGLIGEGMVCFHHVYTRKSFGSDHPSNLMPLCAACHTMIHKIGLTMMSKRYKSVLAWLVANGWSQTGFSGKYYGPKEARRS